jgi:GntR family transcriptional regulator of vanillate catabolism
MIAAGELEPGQRIAEIPTAERLGVSRMPVRTALRALEQEGLVIRLGARGYAARGISASDIAGAIEVRGVLEGLAAGQAASKGLEPAVRRALKRCLTDGDALFAKGEFAAEDLDAYHAMNQKFHAELVKASGNPAIASALATNNSLPFAAATALALDMTDLQAEFVRLSGAHAEHHKVVQALERGDAEAAETLMRAHARAAMRNERVFAGAAAGASRG